MRVLRRPILSKRGTCTCQVPLWFNTLAGMITERSTQRRVKSKVTASLKRCLSWSKQTFIPFSWPSTMVMFFRAKECSQSFWRRSSVIVLSMSISYLSRASVWTWVTHKLLVSSVILLIWIWAAEGTNKTRVRLLYRTAAGVFANCSNFWTLDGCDGPAGLVSSSGGYWCHCWRCDWQLQLSSSPLPGSLSAYSAVPMSPWESKRFSYLVDLIILLGSHALGKILYSVKQTHTLSEHLGCGAMWRLGTPLSSNLTCSDQWSCSERTACRPAAPDSSQTAGSEPGCSSSPPLDPVTKNNLALH